MPWLFHIFEITIIKVKQQILEEMKLLFADVIQLESLRVSKTLEWEILVGWIKDVPKIGIFTVAITT